jgi:hypothetical protein
MKSIDKLLERPGVGRLDKVGLYDLVINTLSAYTTDSRLSSRAQQYAHHLQETYSQLRLSLV